MTVSENQYQAACSEMLGSAVRLLFRTDRRRLSIAALEPQLFEAIRLGQFLLQHDEKGIPRRYLCWAYLADDVSRERLAGNDRILHLDEWNEGTSLWIMDVVAPWGGVRSLLRAAFEGPLKGHKRLYAIRYDSSGNIRPLTIRVRSRGGSFAGGGR